MLPSASELAVQAEREQVLEAIGAFITLNNLELSAANLLAAHAAFSGKNPRLRSRIAHRDATGEGVTQEWLDQQVGGDGAPDREAALDQLGGWLSTSLHRFGDTASSARSAAQDYGRDIAAHVERLTNAQGRPGALESAIESSQHMARTSRAFEDRLREAEAEAATLRAELEQARREASHDPLTDLPNRRGFDALFEAEYRKACASLEPMCVAFCDIDHFKRFNDRFGHDTGDNILRAVGQILMGISNDHCHPARHGGEEFVLIFRGCSPQEAAEQLERAREALSGRRFVHESSGEIIGKVSFSAGIADVFAIGDRRRALRAADEALYRAKELGRDRIEIAAGN